MIQKNLVLAGILAATALSIIATPLAYADSTTNKVITNEQHGEASGNANVNQCANNLIDSANQDNPIDVGNCVQDRTPP